MGCSGCGVFRMWDVRCGCLPGCGILTYKMPSILLCIIAAEVLAIFIDADPRIEGIQIGNCDVKTVNFAYDTTDILKRF